jgi:hypothetical protein
MLARKNGEYTRPIIGDIVDIRLEDCIPGELIKQLGAVHTIAELPYVPEIGQVKKYLVATFGSVDRVDVTQREVAEMLKSGNYLVLPSDPTSKLWAYTDAPWWEYATVVDRAGNYIKAPLIPRAGEPSADEIDELLDEVPQNVGTMYVRSPIGHETLEPVLQESFEARLHRALY